MNKKILSTAICLAMLTSGMVASTYAADISIDLGALFEDETTTPDDNGGNNTEDEDKKDETGDSENKSDSTDDKESTDESDKNQSTSKPTTSTKPTGSSNGSSKNDDDKKDDENNEDNNDEAKDEEADNEAEEAWVNPYSDVKESEWYFEYVKFASQNGLFNGVTENEFAPEEKLTRAMLVTILYRIEGSQDVEGESTFEDVKSGDWFCNAVIWATQNNIVNGMSETEFAPNSPVTREQFATIMYRYASNFKGYDVSVGEDTNILSYDDFSAVSEYAIEALQYTVGSGLITGKTDSTLNPKDEATRAEAATIITRFIKGNE